MVTVKNFRGLNRDGDSPDMPKETLRSLLNWDIDKTTQKLVGREPYYPYTELNSTDTTSDDNAFPSFTGYELHEVQRYTVGIGTLQHNTLVVYKSTTTYDIGGITKYRWKIIDNGPIGGNGYGFVIISQDVVGGTEFEYGITCDVSIVDGIARIAFGNEDDFKIYMAHDREQYFKLDTGAYLINTPSGFDTLCSLTGAKFWRITPTPPTATAPKVQLTDGQWVNVTKSFIYMKGKLYSGAVTALKGETYSTFGKQTLPKGSYSFKVTPLFDDYPVQYGAPITDLDVRINKESEIVPADNITSFEEGKQYRILHAPHIFEEMKVTAKFYNVPSPGLPFIIIAAEKQDSWKIKEAYIPESHSVWLSTTESLSNMTLGQPFTLDWAYYTQKNKVTSPVRTGTVSAKVISTSNSNWGEVQIEFIYHIHRPAKDLEFRIKDNDNEVHSDKDNSIFTFETGMVLKLYDLLTNNTIKSWQLGVAPSNNVPFTITDQIIVTKNIVAGSIQYDSTNPAELPIESKYFSNLDYRITPTGSNTPFDYSGLRIRSTGQFGGGQLNNIITIAAIESVKGLNIKLELEIDALKLNPRIIGYNLYLRRELEGFIKETDYTLIDYFPLNAEINWGQTSAFQALYKIDIDLKKANTSLGYWKNHYSTDGKGYRPFNHTEADITRRMGLIEHRRDRMYCGLIDDDEGQELIGYTPISAGHGQLDVWFRPKLLIRGNGQSYTYLMEFNDNLFWFQKNNLVIGTMGDSNRMVDYQFYGTGGGVGTDLIRTIVKSEKSVFFANYDGIYRIQGNTGENISLGSMQEDWQKITIEEKQNCFAGYNPKTNEYWLYVPGRVVNGEVIREPRIWIWDDNEYSGSTWRMYNLNHAKEGGEPNSLYDSALPIAFFADEQNNWIFVDSQNKSYFWRVNDISVDRGKVNTLPEYPINLEVETQNLGDRVNELVPEMVQVIREKPTAYTDSATPPVTHLRVRSDSTVSIIRNETISTDTSLYDQQKETVVIKKDYSQLPRRIERRRSSTLRVRVTLSDKLEDIYYFDGQDVNIGQDTTLGTHWKRPEIREITLHLVPDKKRAR